MTKEEIIEKVKQAFLGHNVVLVNAIQSAGKEIYSLIVGGQSYELEDFHRLSVLMTDSGYKVLFTVESNVLKLRIVNDGKNY